MVSVTVAPGAARSPRTCRSASGPSPNLALRSTTRSSSASRRGTSCRVKPGRPLTSGRCPPVPTRVPMRIASVRASSSRLPVARSSPPVPMPAAVPRTSPPAGSACAPRRMAPWAAPCAAAFRAGTSPWSAALNAPSVAKPGAIPSTPTAGTARANPGTARPIAPTRRWSRVSGSAATCSGEAATSFEMSSSTRWAVCKLSAPDPRNACDIPGRDVMALARRSASIGILLSV